MTCVRRSMFGRSPKPFTGVLADAFFCRMALSVVTPLLRRLLVQSAAGLRSLLVSPFPFFVLELALRVVGDALDFELLAELSSLFFLG